MSKLRWFSTDGLLEDTIVPITSCLSCIFCGLEDFMVHPFSYFPFL